MAKKRRNRKDANARAFYFAEAKRFIYFARLSRKAGNPERAEQALEQARYFRKRAKTY